MILRWIFRVKKMDAQKIIEEQKDKIASLQETIDMQLETIETVQDALNAVLAENLRLKKKIKRDEDD